LKYKKINVFLAKMIFLGIDIGFDRCGIAILDHDIKKNTSEIVFAGSILTEKSQTIAQRLKVLYTDLLFVKNKYNPEYMCIEKLFFNRQNSTFEKVCMSKGVALLLFSDTEIVEVEPKRMKSIVVGNGNATKSQIKTVIEKLLARDLSKMYDDTIDAIGLAMYQIEATRLEKLQAKR
jgi:crossover junction endodeoxyribonuclease RuvC